MPSPQQLKAQLDQVFALMAVTGSGRRRRVVFGEGAFAELLEFLALVPADRAVAAIYRLSPDAPTIMVAELFNVLLWSAEKGEGIDLDALTEWFYSGVARKIEIALQIDIFPSNSMEESERILDEIDRRFPALSHLCADLRTEVSHRKEEEESWARYRRETFEMPKEMTGSILEIIRDIKG